MSKPQQEEIRRSDRTPVTQDSYEEQAEAQPGEEKGRGRVPPDNQPGHHPEKEQDKPEALGGAGHGRKQKD